MTGVAVVGWGMYVPEERVTNADLEKLMDTSDEWIVERTGIHERRRAAPDESTATMATAAGAQALKSAALTPDDIDLCIVATVTPEQPLPATAAFVQDALGLRCGAFDLVAACSGFVYSLVTAASMMQAGVLNRVLVIGAETISRFTDYSDRGTAIIFGDGAAAVVLERSDDDSLGILAFDLGCDGSAAGFLQVEAGGSRLPASTDTVAAMQHCVTMDGKEIFKRAIRAVTLSVTNTLERAGIDPGDVDVFVPHQANTRIIDALLPRIGIAAERTIVNIENYGNTSGASVPLALCEALDAGRIKPGDLVLLSGFGAGMAWATALVRWGPRV